MLPGVAVSSASAADSTRPNILFIIFDDWGWQHAGAYGSTWVKTPNFDRVAREGVLFKNAFTSNPKCSPCRASVLTGRNTWQLKEACCHNGLFPAGFEIKVDGPATGRMVMLHMVLAMTTEHGFANHSEVTRLVSCHDG